MRQIAVATLTVAAISFAAPTSKYTISQCTETCATAPMLGYILGSRVFGQKTVNYDIPS